MGNPFAYLRTRHRFNKWCKKQASASTLMTYDPPTKQWVAHCLDLDIISQGNSIDHATEMLREAVGMSVWDDLESDTYTRQTKAPPEYWQEYLKAAPLDVRHTAGVRIQIGAAAVAATAKASIIANKPIESVAYGEPDTDEMLDKWGRLFAVHRMPDEGDESFRERLLASFPLVDRRREC